MTRRYASETRTRRSGRLLWLLAVVWLTGCSRVSGSAPRAAPVPAVGNIRSSPLVATLRATGGQSASVYLYANDQSTSVANGLSCLAQPGDRILSGHFAYYLARGNAGPTLPAGIAPFRNELMEFNEQWLQRMLVTLPGEPGRLPDLLLVYQYASCNGSLVAPLVLSDDGNQLLQVRFQTAGRQVTYIFASSVESLGPGRLRTTAYDNRTSKTTTTTWTLQAGEALLVPER